MPSNTKEILDTSVDGQESLRLLSRFEPTHLPFSFSGVLMRDFSAIVRVTAGVVRHVRQNSSERSSITFQFIGDDSHWFFALVSQQSQKESFGRTLITARLKQNVDDVTVLIDRPPKVMLLTVDSYKEFV